MEATPQLKFPLPRWSWLVLSWQKQTSWQTKTYSQREERGRKMSMSLSHHIFYSPGGNRFVTADDNKQNTEHPGTFKFTTSYTWNVSILWNTTLPVVSPQRLNPKKHKATFFVLHAAQKKTKTWPVPKTMPGKPVCSVRIVQAAHIPDNMIKTPARWCRMETSLCN